jgi:hypothetical protein
MRGLNTLVLLVMVAVCVVGAIGLVRDWRADGESSQFDQPPLWQWGRASWFGLRRLTLVGQLWVMVLTYSWLFPEQVASYAIALGALLVPMLSVFLFNRPRMIVPPALRHQDGLLVEHLRRLRTRRRSD